MRNQGRLAMLVIPIQYRPEERPMGNGAFAGNPNQFGQPNNKLIMNTKIKRTIGISHLLLAMIVILLVLTIGKVQAQTNTPPVQTNTTAILDGFKSSTNWVLIPYGKYDLQHKTFGFGAAALYEASPNLWVGARLDRIDGEQTTAGVQAQLQVSGTWMGITYTPFLETSVGLGTSTIYASAGPGLAVNLYNWQISSRVNMNIGIVGDYEHVVRGSDNHNELNIGPMFNLSF